jgi:hypothetical protein
VHDAVNVPLPPLHNGGVFDAVGAKAVGWVIVVVAVPVQPLLSVTVIVYVPAVNPATVVVVCPLLHEYVYGPVPPVTPVTDTLPVAPPLQSTLVSVAVGVITAPVVDTIAVAVWVHPFASVTVTV